jgi:hypothetical protein
MFLPLAFTEKLRDVNVCDDHLNYLMVPIRSANQLGAG